MLASMVSMLRRWVAVVPLVGASCDLGVGKEVPRVAIAVCETPTLEDPVGCTAPDALDPVVEETIDPALAGDPFLRAVEILVPAGADQVVAVGTYGDFFAEGAFAVAIDPAATRIWSATIPATTEATAIAAVGDADGVWIAAAQFEGETIARRYDLAGEIAAEAVIADFTVESLQAQAGGAVALSGTRDDQPAYVGLAIDGAELWNGDENLAEGPRVVADGSAQYFDGPGAAVWEVDPRGEPDPGFPIDIGLQHAIVTSLGDVLAIGQVLGPFGNNTLLVWISAAGEQGLSMGIPRALADVVLEAPKGGAVVAGRSFHCSAGTYLASFDGAGVLLLDARVEAPPRPWVLDVDLRATSVAADSDGLVLRAYEVMP
jgi:hypothetical protein